MKPRGNLYGIHNDFSGVRRTEYGVYINKEQRLTFPPIVAVLCNILLCRFGFPNRVSESVSFSLRIRVSESAGLVSESEFSNPRATPGYPYPLPLLYVSPCWPYLIYLILCWPRLGLSLPSSCSPMLALCCPRSALC